VRLRFDDCVLDTDLRQLTRAGQAVPLAPKAFRLLEVLAERRPRVVAQGELRRLLWPDGLVGGTRLARLVNEVREAIGDESPGRVIRTAHRFGYAFAGGAVDESAPAERPDAPAPCALEWGLRLVPLLSGENVIGRAPGALVSIPSSRVSRRHARILVSEGRAMLEDLGSKNGTYLGERKVQHPLELKHGDCITVGPVRLVFQVSGMEETCSTDGEERPGPSGSGRGR
jgi:DNA-binding winged helix-turn-helix (wHTH) protein